jgi:hypothetical protein
MPWRYRQRIARVCAAALSLGYVLAWAGASLVQSEPDLLTLPWLQIAVGAAIASWGGATATLGRYLAAEYDARPFRWRLEVIRDTAVSVTVGAGAYLAGAWYGLNPLQIALLLLTAGYLGVRVLNTVADRLLDLVSRKPE